MWLSLVIHKQVLLLLLHKPFASTPAHLPRLAMLCQGRTRMTHNCEDVSWDLAVCLLIQATRASPEPVVTAHNSDHLAIAIHKHTAVVVVHLLHHLLLLVLLLLSWPAHRESSGKQQQVYDK